MRKPVKIIVTIVLSIISGISFGLRVLSAATLHQWSLFAAFIVPTLVFGVFYWFFDRAKIYQRFIGLSRRQKMRWSIVAALFFLFFVSVLPYEKPIIQTTHTLKVQTVENKYAPEVRPVVIEKLYFTRSGKQISFEELQLAGWVITPEGLTSEQTGDVFLYSSIYADGITMVAPTEFEYGMIEVTYDGKTDRYNLYGYPWEDPDYIVLNKHSWGTPSVAWLLAGIAGVIGDVWLIYSSLLIVIFWLANLDQKASKRIDQPAYMIFLYALPLLAVWTIFLLAFWPGIVPYDPLSQLSQAKSGVIYDDHPAIHTIFMQIMLQVWDSPASIVIIRYIFLSFVVGYGIWTLRQSGIPASVAWILSALFAISPVTSTTSINLWKDVPYAIVFLLLVIFVFKIIITRGQWVEKPLHWVILGVVISFVGVFRHNGLLPAVVVIFFSMIFYKEYWKKWVSIALVALTVYLLIVNPLYEAFNVQDKSAQVNMLGKWAGYGLASYIYEEVDMPTEAMLYLDNIIPVKTGWNYDCYSFSRSFGTGEGLFPGGKGFLLNLFKRVTSDPEIYWHHWVCNTEHLWRLRPNDNPMAAPWAAYVSDINPATADTFDLDYRSKSKIPALKQILSEIEFALNNNSQLNWFFWRPALYFYIAIAASLLAYFRSKNKGYLVFFFLLVAQTASIGIGIGSAWVRYSFAMMTTAMLFWPLLFWQPLEVNENLQPAEKK